MSKLGGRPIVFVDVETTGLGANDGHIIDIGIIRVQNGTIVAEYNQLLDPGVDVPYFITNLTGISNQDVKDKPQFAHVSGEVDALFEGAVFVAHNVGFDYSFFSSEYKRIGQKLAMDRFCTARLSRALNPQHRRHNLDSLIGRGGYLVANRHRAYDDAYVLYQFYCDAQRDRAKDLEAAIDRVFVRGASLDSDEPDASAGPTKLTYVPFYD